MRWPRVYGDPPELFTWDITATDGAHECGVTGDRTVAIGNVHSALADAPPGTSGTVRRVTIGQSGRIGYIDLGEVAHAHRDEATEGILWESPDASWLGAMASSAWTWAEHRDH